MRKKKRLPITQRRFLRYLLGAEGWLPEDSFHVKEEVIVALESRKLVRVERAEGRICQVTITSLGIAAYRWGSAALAAAA